MESSNLFLSDKIVCLQNKLYALKGKLIHAIYSLSILKGSVSELKKYNEEEDVN